MSKSTTQAKTAPIAMMQFHADIYAIARTGHNAGQTMARKMQELLISRYDKPLIDKSDTAHWGKPCAAGGPTYEEYRNDQQALAELAKSKGLADNQWVRKPYAAAVKALYGALPVAMTAEAMQKRAQREANEAQRKAHEEAVRTAGAAALAGKPGAVKDETTDRKPSPDETLEQLIARVGVFQALDACVRILSSEDMTKAQAQHIAAMVKQAKTASQQPIAKNQGKRKAA